MAKQILGDNKLENGVAEKFQTLIVKMIALRLMTQARVREGLREQKRVSEFVADAFFEWCHCFAILSEIEKSLNSVSGLSFRTK